MSEVVLRCPSCGTTQAMAGECEACHEADVRYFCPNHSPGRWLDGAVCAECAARANRERLTPRAPPRREPRGAEPLPPAPRSARRPPPSPVVPPARAAEPLPPRPGPTVPRWPAGVPAERASGGVVEPLPPRPPRAPTPPGILVAGRGVPVVGCLVRLVLVIALLVVLAIGAVIALVGSGAVRGWVVEVGQSTGVMTGVPAQTERGIAAYEAGDVARAERELREAAQLYPRSPLAPLYLGRIRLEAGDVERAGEYLRAAVSRDPASAAAHRELGAYYAARAESAESRDGNGAAARLDLLDAAREYGRALELDPRDDVARGAYGCTLAALGRADESDEVLAPLGGIATCAAR